MPSPRWSAIHDAAVIVAAARGDTQAQFSDAHGFSIETIRYHCRRLRMHGLRVVWAGSLGAGAPVRMPGSTTRRTASPQDLAGITPSPRLRLDGWAMQFRRQERREMTDAEAVAGGARLRAAYEARVKAGGGTTPHRPDAHVVSSRTPHAPKMHGDAP